ncbi:hypothetical protein GC163_20545 [bacterium]|nr:hypothetical protein [bacterium]
MLPSWHSLRQAIFRPSQSRVRRRRQQRPAAAYAHVTLLEPRILLVYASQGTATVFDAEAGLTGYGSILYDDGSSVTWSSGFNETLLRNYNSNGTASAVISLRMPSDFINTAEGDYSTLINLATSAEGEVTGLWQYAKPSGATGLALVSYNLNGNILSLHVIVQKTISESAIWVFGGDLVGRQEGGVIVAYSQERNTFTGLDSQLTRVETYSSSLSLSSAEDIAEVFSGNLQLATSATGLVRLAYRPTTSTVRIVNVHGSDYSVSLSGSTIIDLSVSDSGGVAIAVINAGKSSLSQYNSQGSQSGSSIIFNDAYTGLQSAYNRQGELIVAANSRSVVPESQTVVDVVKVQARSSQNELIYDVAEISGQINFSASLATNAHGDVRLTEHVFTGDAFSIRATSFQLPRIRTVTASEDETENGSTVFGRYIVGVPHYLEFFIDTTLSAADSDVAVLKYEIGSGSGVITGTAERVGEAAMNPRYKIVVEDAGKLPKGDLTFKIALTVGSETVYDTFDGVIQVVEDLSFTVKGRADDSPEGFIELSKFRLLEDVGVTLDLEGILADLPLDTYYYNKFEIAILEADDPDTELFRTDVIFQKVGGQYQAIVENWNAGSARNVLTGEDYEVVLRARKQITTKYDGAFLLVESVPKWLMNTSQMPLGHYDTTDHRFEFHVSLPTAFSDVVSATTSGTPFGLFDNLETRLTAGLVFDVYAGLRIDESAYAVARELEAVVKILGKTLYETHTEIAGDLTSTLNKQTLVTNQLNYKTPVISLIDPQHPVKLIDVSFGKDVNGKAFKIDVPQAVLQATGLGLVSKVIQLSGSFIANAHTLNVEGTFVLDVRDSSFKFVKDKSTVKFTAAADTTTTVAAKAGLFWQDFDLVAAKATGKLWVDIGGAVTIGINGSLLSPSFRIRNDLSYLAAQVGYQLQFDWAAIGVDFEGDPIRDYGKPVLLLGDNAPPQSLRSDHLFTIKGQNFVVGNDDMVPPVPLQAGLTPASLFASDTAPDVSELVFDAPLDPYASHIDLEFDIDSDVSMIAANRHQLEILAISADEMQPTITLGNVDLANYSLTADTASLGFRSETVSLSVPVEYNDRVPGESYQLVLRLTNTPVAGERVRVRARELGIVTSEPELNIAAENNVLTDGVITVGASPDGSPYAELLLTNSGLPLLSISDIRVLGGNFRLADPEDEDGVFVYADDLPTPLRIEVIDPSVDSSGQLQFRTNDPAKPLVTLDLQFTAAGNHPPTDIVLSTTSVAENLPSGTPFADLSAIDPDAGNTFTYRFVTGEDSNDNSKFRIAGNQLRTGSKFDFEAQKSYLIRLRAIDQSGKYVDREFHISVVDINEAPLILDQAFTVIENSPVPTLVGRAVANDPDIGDSFYYKFSGGNVNKAFAIDSATGAITVSRAFAIDYETLPTYLLRVQVIDAGRLTTKATIRVELTDANDPPNIDPQAFSVEEHASSGTVVGTVLASDQDAGQVLSYAITGGNVGKAFGIHAATGQLFVAKSSAIDLVSTPTFSLTVQITDSLGAFRKAAIVVNVVAGPPPTVDDWAFFDDERNVFSELSPLMSFSL